MTMLSFLGHGATRPTAFTQPGAPFKITTSLSRGLQIASLEQAQALLLEAHRVIADQEEKIRQLENCADTDFLTGFMNKRGLMAALRRELALTRRAKKSGGLLIIVSVDGFREVLDTYGHPMGDAYLQTMASVLLNEVRTSDILARLSLDSFAILMPQISAKHAAQRLAKLEKVLATRVMHTRERSIPLRASVGHAMLEETETPESLLVAADTRLYANKAQELKASAMSAKNRLSVIAE